MITDSPQKWMLCLDAAGSKTSLTSKGLAKNENKEKRFESLIRHSFQRGPIILMLIISFVIILFL